MMLLVALSLCAVAFAKIPAFPSFLGFPATIDVDASPTTVSTFIAGRIVIGTIDLPGTAASSLTRANLLRSARFTISDNVNGACLNAIFEPTAGLADTGNIIVTTRSSIGSCKVTATVSDEFRQTSTFVITVNVITPPKRDCVFGSARTPPNACHTETIAGVVHDGVRTTFGVVIQDATGGGVCDVNATRVDTLFPASGCPAEDCIVSDVFGSFSACDCDNRDAGVIQFTFIVKNLTNGGAACPPIRNNTQPCPADVCIDCKLTAFSEFGECSKSCGGGVRFRTRSVEVVPANGGKPCPAGAAFVEEEACSTDACPIPTVDCVLDFGPFSPCSVTCGEGITTREQIVKTPASGPGAVACPRVLDVDTEPCVQPACITSAPTPAPVDCVVAFAEFSACSVTCGEGTRTREQVVVTPASGRGAAPCPTLAVETETCVEEACFETCVNRCGAVGRARGGVREATEEDEVQFGTAEETSVSKQVFRFRRTQFRPRLNLGGAGAAVPQCGCDALCARALAVNNCCDDIATACVNIRVLPARQTGPIRPTNPTVGSCVGGVFRSGPSPSCPDIAVGQSGFFTAGCVPC